MPTTAAAAQNLGVIETSIKFIQDGGFFMYPIPVSYTHLTLPTQA